VSDTPSVQLRDVERGDAVTDAAPVGHGPGRPAGQEQMAPRDRRAVSLLLVSTFTVILNETIMGVALPRLMSDLDITASTAQWLTTAFMLTMAVVIPVTGFLLQRITTRAAFLLAMSLFSVGTSGLVCYGTTPGRLDVNGAAGVNLDDLYAWESGSGARDVDASGSVTAAKSAI